MGNENNEVEPPQSNQKYHKIEKRMKKKIIFITLVILAVAVPVLGYKYYEFAVNREAQSHKEAVFEIESGQSITQIAKNLYQKDLVNSEFLFKLYVAVNGLTPDIEAGVYTIPAGASISQLADIFQHGTNEISVTFLEGWRVEQFALKANESLSKIDYEKFVSLASADEGYLFPDTYFFDAEVTEEEMIDVLTSNFERKARPLIADADLEFLGLDEDEVVTLASIVEREVPNEEDRRIVAGILLKRLRNGELLGADATTQYAISPYRYCTRPEEPVSDYKQICSLTSEEARSIDWWPNSLSQDELDYPSPFNTRSVSGLPPHPISSPGLDAIDAVLNYRDTNYNFYMADPDGVTYYSDTLEGHNENVQKYLQ